jgi:hypothetical protein
MAIGYLVGATTGWNDEAVVIYINEVESLTDPDALNVAVRHVVKTWSEARRPPVSILLDAYRMELARKTTSTPALATGRQRVVPFAEGIDICRRAYEDECRRLGRQPNDKLFARITERIK